VAFCIDVFFFGLRIDVFNFMPLLPALKGYKDQDGRWFRIFELDRYIVELSLYC